MPYIVTTKPGPDPLGRSQRGYDSRRAVATLEEARALVSRAYHPFDHPDGRDINQRVLFLDGTPYHRTKTTGWRGIGEDGGSALLPDGTVIEVERRSVGELIEELARIGITHGPAGDVTEAVIDAFNAAPVVA